MLKKLGLKNILRLALMPFSARVARLSFMGRSGLNYKALDEGNRAVQSTYRNYDLDGLRHVSHEPMPVGLWKLSNAEVVYNHKFPMVVQKSSLNLLPRTEEGPFHLYENDTWHRGFQIFGPVADRYLLKMPRRKIHQESAIYVGTRAPTNWSHWLINFLPGVMLAAGFEDNDCLGPLIVPENYASGPSRGELFELFWGSRPILELNANTRISVSELHWFEQPYSDSPRPKDLAQLLPKSANITLMKEFRRRILEFSEMNLTLTEFPRKVFLAREVGYSRDYNVQEVNEAAEKAGYQPIYLNRLSVADQVAVMHNAERVVGPHGSALANVIFCKSGAKVMELGNRISRIEDWDAPLADVGGAQMYISYAASVTEPGSNEFDIDIRILKEILKEF